MTWKRVELTEREHALLSLMAADLENTPDMGPRSQAILRAWIRTHGLSETDAKKVLVWDKDVGYFVEATE